jgi:hypothetical protein
MRLALTVANVVRLRSSSWQRTNIIRTVVRYAQKISLRTQDDICLDARQLRPPTNKVNAD